MKTSIYSYINIMLDNYYNTKQLLKSTASKHLEIMKSL
jgi:hypothetical protein